MATLLFACPSRFGDIILGSIFSNMLVAMGYEVTDLVLSSTYSFHTRVLAGTHRLLTLREPTAWFPVTTPFLRGIGKYDYYLNVQPGSPEHHDHYFSSGLSALDFVRGLIEKEIGEPLPPFSQEYLSFDARFLLSPLSGKEENLLLIAPESVSTKPVLNPTLIQEVVRAFPHSHPRVLLKEGSRARYGVEPLFTRSFEEAVVTLLGASVFVGNDSGLAWASLYNPHSIKHIYHHKARMALVNNRFHEVDPRATDHVLETQKEKKRWW